MKLTPLEFIDNYELGDYNTFEIVAGVYHVFNEDKSNYLGTVFDPIRNPEIGRIQEIEDNDVRHILRDMEVRLRVLEDIFLPNKYKIKSKKGNEKYGRSGKIK